ncbi:MAG: cell division protein [Rhizobiales bacterium]|nr:cell division protein [Hyphomicrobiales bacterium]MBA69087.1 cell division protein [Hyphomicrobiales bacterium]|tara:strand:+ start:335 stop:655 length:321 start_codon:yes stop_codon:yes gene_type:complete
MRTKFRKRKAYGRLVVPFLSLICFSYFGFHALHGTFGLESASHLEVRRAELAAELAALEAEREALEKRVALMSDGSMEADMLDERARYMLNVARPDEVVYFIDRAN